MAVNSRDFVEWREHFVSQERGNRVVHFFLEDSSGESFLAAVGTERSLRHMLYVVAEEFLKEAEIEKSAASTLKWRSRREVVDWLKTFLPKQISNRDPSSSPITTTSPLDGINDPETYPTKNMDRSIRNFRSHSSDIFWSGMSWICSKQLKHYKAFCRNGTTISIHSFVIVMSEGEENHYLAYVEDMYEDKKGQKKVKVRWFHQNQELVGSIPPPTPHPREVFITPYTQVISAECLDDVATVLTPDHYDKCLATLPYACSAGIHLCFRQYSKNKFKSFDLSMLHGYLDQSILGCLDICRIKCLRGYPSKVPKNGSMIQDERLSPSERNGLSVKLVGPSSCIISPFRIHEKVELLSQDSGIRGCWFRCTVLQICQRKLKVQYDDLMDEEGLGNLEEWVPLFRRAAPCKLRLRHSGRLMIRPCRSHDDSDEPVDYEIGCSVDVWRDDGWWEGLVVGVNSFSDIIKVYFPGEEKVSDCRRGDMRISKDWIMHGWVNIDARPLELSSMISSSEDAHASSFLSSDMSDLDATIACTPVKSPAAGSGAALDVTKVYSRKRRRDDDGVKQEVDKDMERMGDGQSP